MKFTILVQPYMQQRDENKPLAGRDRQRFTHLLERLKEQMQFADRAGFHGMCMTEQHLQIEGIEVTTNPVLYDLFIAQHTQHLRVGQLGIPLSAHNPIQVAEDLALADHFTGGRLFCGFSRGNTPRWAETFSQHLGLSSATSDKSERDRENRAAFYECVDIVKRLWTEDTVRIDGKYWQVPLQTTHWDFAPTRLWGAGADDSGQLREIGIVPKPWQDPHPPIYAPFAFSMETARFWARTGGKLVSFVPKDDFIQTTIDVYRDEAAKAGRHDVTAAESVALGGHLILGRDESHTKDLYRAFEDLYNLAYDAPPYHVPMGRLFTGSGNQVADEIAQLHERFGVDEFVLWHHVGYFSQEEELGMLEIFADSVIRQLS